MRTISKASFILLFFTLLPLQGCLDPKAVTDFADAAAATIALIDEVGKDMMESCERIKEVQPADIDCSKTDVYVPLKSVESVLLAYVVNLKRLADKDGVTFSENIDALADEVKNLERFDEKKVDALKTIGSAIAEGIASRYRQKDLAKFIPAADAAFADVIGGIKEIIHKDYRETLGDEQAAIQMKLKTVNARFKDTEPLAVENTIKALERRQRDINSKLSSIDKYLPALDTLVKAHHELSVNASDIDSDEVITNLKKYTTEIKKAVKEVKEAF